jgi:hypothetical protein
MIWYERHMMILRPDLTYQLSIYQPIGGFDPRRDVMGNLDQFSLGPMGFSQGNTPQTGLGRVRLMGASPVQLMSPARGPLQFLGPARGPIQFLGLGRAGSPVQLMNAPYGRYAPHGMMGPYGHSYYGMAGWWPPASWGWWQRVKARWQAWKAAKAAKTLPPQAQAAVASATGTAPVPVPSGSPAMHGMTPWGPHGWAADQAVPMSMQTRLVLEAFGDRYTPSGISPIDPNMMMARYR